MTRKRALPAPTDLDPIRARAEQPGLRPATGAEAVLIADRATLLEALAERDSALLELHAGIRALAHSYADLDHDHFHMTSTGPDDVKTGLLDLLGTGA